MGATDMEKLKLLQMLDSSNDLDIQLKGIIIASSLKDLNPFIQPMEPQCNKNVWENCAKIVAHKTDAELSPYLYKLLEWIQDLNWPGAFIIIERLKKTNGFLLANPYQKAVLNALKMPADSREWLDNLSILIENTDMANRIDGELLNILKQVYGSFWEQDVR